MTRRSSTGAADPNLYGYVGGRAFNATDPDGREAITAVAILTGAAIGAASGALIYTATHTKQFGKKTFWEQMGAAAGIGAAAGAIGGAVAPVSTGEYEYPSIELRRLNEQMTKIIRLEVAVVMLSGIFGVHCAHTARVREDVEVPLSSTRRIAIRQESPQIACNLEEAGTDAVDVVFEELLGERARRLAKKWVRTRGVLHVAFESTVLFASQSDYAARDWKNGVLIRSSGDQFRWRGCEGRELMIEGMLEFSDVPFAAPLGNGVLTYARVVGLQKAGY